MTTTAKCALTACPDPVAPGWPCCEKHVDEWGAQPPIGAVEIEQWIHQKNHSGEIVYEAWFRASKIAYERFGKALLYHKVKLIDSFILTGTPVALVKGTPAAVRLFAEACHLEDVRYRSPTIFDNGTLVAIYASPEDDIAGVKTKAAIYVEQAKVRLDQQK